MAAFDDTLVGFAGWLGYPRGERAAAWLARLEVNRPEIESWVGRRGDDWRVLSIAQRLELVAPCSR